MKIDQKKEKMRDLRKPSALQKALKDQLSHCRQTKKTTKKKQKCKEMKKNKNKKKNKKIHPRIILIITSNSVCEIWTIRVVYDYLRNISYNQALVCYFCIYIPIWTCIISIL